MARRRAKIVCTLGPSTSDEESILALGAAGMDVARLNLSHGTHEEHARLYSLVRSASRKLDRPIAVLVDLQGPKIRLGTFTSGSAVWYPGDEVTITAESVEGNARCVSTDFPRLPATVHPGDVLLVDDGNLSLEVLKTTATSVLSRVVDGGRVSDHKGISLPGLAVDVPALTPKDDNDLRFAVQLGADLVALSFVQRPEDILSVRATLRAAGSNAGVIAKVEKAEAVARLAAIVLAFDGIMLARGDLGVETPLEEVPLVQRRAIQLAREASKPIIVATQMLESMVENPRPTRAEVSDVATAVFDGADAMMLSAETSVGRHPQESVKTMDRIIGAIEAEALSREPAIAPSLDSIQAALAQAAIGIAENVGARALAAFTQTGSTARLLARHRPETPIVAFTPDETVRSQLALSWGVESAIVPAARTTDEMVSQVERALIDTGRAVIGDSVVIVAGTPVGEPGTTNTVRVERLGLGT